MSAADHINATGQVVKIERGFVRVAIDGTDKVILCHLSGKMQQHRIRCVLGDSVDIEMSPYDLTRGRVVYRRK